MNADPSLARDTPAPHDFEGCLEPCPDVVTADVGEEVVLLNAETGVYYSLNPVAAFIWRRVTKGEPLPEIRGALAAEFSVDVDQASADVARFAAELVHLKLAHKPGR